MEQGRWVEVSPSQFTHEAEGLRLVRELLPDVDPFRAWSNFEFRDTQGRWHEVDLAVLGRDTLYLVELKYYAGRLTGDDLRWKRDGRRAEDSPLLLARRKSQYFATLLQDRLREIQRGQGQPNARRIVPYVQEAVFLHHPGFVCDLPERCRQGLYGLEGAEQASGLKPLSELLLAPAKREPIDAHRSRLINGLMAKVGLVQRRQREVGSWVIDEDPLGEGDGWQDWPAFHRVTTTDKSRIRFFIPAPGSGDTARRRLERRIEHEYRLMSRLHHDGVQTPRDLVKADLGTGLVYSEDDRLTRLDLWFADHPNGMALAHQLSVIRQIAEALNYAHRHRVVHRGLAPSAITVRDRGDQAPAVKVENWESAGTVPTSSASHVASSVVESSANPSARAMAGEDALFEAPEGRWTDGADRIRLDVFGLGALAFAVLTNNSRPASDRGELVDRLRRDGGLDPAVELPQVPSKIRSLVLAATNPRPSERTPNVAAFLSQLDEAEEELHPPTEVEEADPLDAAAGALLAGRYKLIRRLGAGSTAVGLLVTDEQDGGKQRVLKVAKDDAAAARLDAEEVAIRPMEHDNIVELIRAETIGPRRALVLQYAGDTTLADELAQRRGRLHLDLLERWGTDLLTALVELDRVGVFHRDIKPSNLGVRIRTKKSDSRLVLFDFSMSGTDPRAVTAGTPHYRDPFLGGTVRMTYDSAADRYGAAVVLYEMATGQLPRYGSDPDADPATVTDDVTIDGGWFDPSVREDFEAFFAAALARDAAARHDTAEDMRRSWTSIFERLTSRAPVAAHPVKAATLDSSLAEAGLSARAVSALEPDITTVSDLLLIDPAQQNRLLDRIKRESKTTGAEIHTRLRQWRKEFRDQLAGRSRKASATTLPDPLAAARLLADIAQYPRSQTRHQAAELILGLQPGLDAFASQQELALAVGRSVPRGHQLIKELQTAWSKDDTTKGLLDQLVNLIAKSLQDLGGVAAVKTLAAEILAALPENPADQREDAERASYGLLRLALDRYNEHERAESRPPLAKRRHGGHLALIAVDQPLLDAADAASALAASLVEEAAAHDAPVVPQQKAIRAIRRRFETAFRQSADPGADVPAIADLRLVRLAAQAAQNVGLSARGELHSVDMPPPDAVRLALAGVTPEEVSEAELIDRVRARFPDLPALPRRPQLDGVLERAGLDLHFDDGAYRSTVPEPSGTSGLQSKVQTALPPSTEVALTRGDHLDRVFAESVQKRSFLALGMSVVNRPDAVDHAAACLQEQFGGEIVDVTGLMIGEMKRVAAAKNLPWEVVIAADAATPGSRDARGLHALVDQVVPALSKQIDDAVFRSDAGSGPLMLTELSPLARYGHLGVVARWSELAARRMRPVWVIVPQLDRVRGPIVDGKPIQLGSNGQFVAVDESWLAGREPAVTP